MKKIILFISLLFITSCDLKDLSPWDDHEWEIRYEIVGDATNVHVEASVCDKDDIDADITVLPWDYSYDVVLNDADWNTFKAKLSVMKIDGSGLTSATIRLYVRGKLEEEKVITTDNVEVSVKFECDSYE